MLIEKLSPIRNERDSMFVDEEESIKKRFEMTNGNGMGGGGGGEDLSIIEYGPGIVKKLRSRYQSLALRQYTARPSLRRSASLENVLDAVSAEELAATLENKISNGHDLPDEYTNGRQTRPRNRFIQQNSEDSRTSSPVLSERDLSQENNKTESQQNGKSHGPRGRTSGPDASARRDRMRRARSVDALHRTKREEEILEKFKHVVLPKEEIVIIEVSKPQQGSVVNGNVFSGMGDNGNNISGGMTNGEKRFPTRLLFTANNLRNSAGVLDQQTANRVRNLMISPEHELPPHDIVRETARIFERNQENLNRRIGQALRLSKSASASGLGGVGGSSPLASPESPTPTNPQQQKTVTAQSTTSSSTTMQDKSFSTTKTSSKVEATTNPAMANGPSHGQKQIGIIKPTLSNINGGSVNGAGKIANGSANLVNGGSGPVENNRVRSPILSPIGFTSNKPLLQNSNKPPLSPKPIFTSSPKVNIPVGGNSKVKSGGGLGALGAESPSTSPILIIENKDRSISPFNSESPIPRVKSPVSSRTKAASPTTGSLEDKNDAFMRSTSPLNGKASPPVVEGDSSGAAVGKRLGNQINQVTRTKSPEPKEKEVIIKTNKTVSNSAPSLQNGLQQNSNSGSSSSSTEHHRQQVTKDQPPAPPPRTISPNVPTPSAPTEATTPSTNSNSKQVSQLRVHQKQKSSQGGNGSMVFNFTSRKDIPNYIEDDGLRRSAAGNGPQMGAGDDPLSSLDKDSVDSKIIPAFEGANIIINGRSSIQKKPKSQKVKVCYLSHCSPFLTFACPQL